MKKTFIILTALALFANSCTTSKQAATSQDNGITNATVEEQYKSFCQSFIDCIMSGELEKALAYFDPGYVKMQHDDFLEGRTSQFLSEFLAGMNLEGSAYVVPENLTDIEMIIVKDVQVNLDENEASAVFEIKLINGEEYSVNVNLLIDDDNKLYFMGAMG